MPSFQLSPLCGVYRQESTEDTPGILISESWMGAVQQHHLRRLITGEHRIDLHHRAPVLFETEILVLQAAQREALPRDRRAWLHAGAMEFNCMAWAIPCPCLRAENQDTEDEKVER